MSDTPYKNTAYGLYVNTNLPQAMIAGQGMYSYLDLANLVGLKPTGNFRKRVKALVAKGIIEAHAAFTPRGGIETRFMAFERSREEIPF